MAILMAIFLSFSLTTSMAMNWYNRHVALRGG
jgi:ABC-type amino acid transport system permease subunit